MNADQISEARALAGIIPQAITAVNTCPWIVIQYVPTLGTSGASAHVTIDAAAETMDFLVDSSSAAGADAIGGDSSMFTLVGSAYDTMGELVDAINGVAAWRAYLVGALRSDVPSHLNAATTTRVDGANGGTFYADTSDSNEVSCAISGEKFTNNGKSGHVTDWDAQCENALLYASINVTCVSALSFIYYSGKAGSAEVAMTATKLLTSATAQLDGEENPSIPFIQAPRGHRLIIRVIGDSSAVISALAVNVLGKTAVLSGTRQVTEDNY